MTGCKRVIGVDRVKSRLQLAQQLGASDVIDTTSSGIDLVSEVKKLTDGDGASIVVDTTGVPKLLEAGLAFTANRGKMIILGAPPADFSLSVHMLSFLSVR